MTKLPDVRWQCFFEIDVPRYGRSPGRDPYVFGPSVVVIPRQINSRIPICNHCKGRTVKMERCASTARARAGFTEAAHDSPVPYVPYSSKGN